MDLPQTQEYWPLVNARPEKHTAYAFQWFAMALVLLLLEASRRVIGPALPVIGGCTVLVNGPLWWDWSLWMTLLVFAAVMAVALTLLKLLGFLGGDSTASSKNVQT